MKRDMDTIREMMLYFEETLKPGGSIQSTDLSSFYDAHNDDSYREMAAHVNLLAESGLIDAPLQNMRGFKIYMINRITTKGHDFLDALRSDSVWNSVKSKATAAGGFTVSMLVDLGKEYLKQQLGLTDAK